jgi:gamma-glutamyltranspeptidase/glutathione hydrolase
MRAAELEPVRGEYRALEVLSAPFPAGGAAVVLALNVLDRFERGRVARAGPDRIHLLLEASRAAHRKTYGDWRPAETSAVLAARREVAAELASVIRPDRIQADAAFDPAPPAPAGNHGTTQLSVVDAEGNVVSMTLTLGRVWGAGVVSRLGFVWNGILEDFDVSGRMTQAALVPWARPVTTVAPTLLLKEGAPFLVLGSAGSGRITSAVIQVVSEVVDRGKALGEAVSAPRVLWSGLGGDDRFYVEPAGEIGPAELRGMRERLYWEIYAQEFPALPINLSAFGGVNAILVEADGTLVGAGDSRRQGAAAAPAPPK